VNRGTMNMIKENVIKIYTDNIIGLNLNSLNDPNNSSGNHVNEFIIDLIFSEIKKNNNTTINNFTISFDATGKNLFHDTDSGTDPLEKIISDAKKSLTDRYSFLKQIQDDKKIPSLDNAWGFIREQYSGSCTYNGILLAILDTMREIEDISIYHIRYRIESNLLQDKLRQVQDKEITLRFSDRTVIDALEVSAKNEYRNIIDFTKDNPQFKERAEKYAKDKYAEKINIVNKLRLSLPSREYPEINLRLKTQDQEKNKSDDVNKNHGDQLLEFDDIAKNISLITDTKLLDPMTYTRQIMGKIIRMTREFINNPLIPKDEKRSKIYDLYNALIDNTGTGTSTMNDDKKNSAVNLTILYLMLFCLDNLLFTGYTGYHNKDQVQKDSMKNNFLRNQHITGFIDNIDLNQMIDLIQKYELFFPLNDDNYYIGAINSLKQSFSSESSDSGSSDSRLLRFPELNIMINLNQTVDSIGTQLLKIDGIMHLNDFIIEKYSIKANKSRGYSHYSHSQRQENIRKIKVYEFTGTNEELSTKMHHINTMSPKDQQSLGLDMVDYQHYAQSTQWSIGDRYSANNDSILLYFQFSEPVGNFSFDIKQYSENGRESENTHIRINIKSNIVILDPWNIGIGRGEYQIETLDNSNGNHEVIKLYAYLLDRKSENLRKLFDSTKSHYQMLRYVSQGINTQALVDQVIDFEEIHRLICSGDMEEVNDIINKHYRWEDPDRHTRNYRFLSHGLFPNKDLRGISDSNFYVFDQTGDHEVSHNLYNVTNYLDYYRKTYQKMMEDPLIRALEHHDQHKKIYSQLLDFSKLLFKESQITQIHDPEIDSLKITERTQIELRIRETNVSKSSKVIDLDETYQSIIRITDKKQTLINGFTLIQNQRELSDLLQILESGSEPGSVYFLKNMIQICKEIDHCFIGTKIQDNVLKEAILCITDNHQMIEERKQIVKNYPWNCIKTPDPISGLESGNIRMIKPPIDGFGTHGRIDYVKFTDENFGTIIPDVDPLDKKSVEMFVIFCYHVLINQCYKILNMWMPQLVSVYHNKQSDFCLKLIDFMLQSKYFNSPYNYYFLNKLHLMIHGEFDYQLVYELMKRESYYPEIYTEIYPETQIQDHPVDFLLSDTWINLIGQRPNKDTMSKEFLVSVINDLDEIVRKKNYSYQYIDLNHVLAYSTICDYLMDPKNYNQRFIDLQLNMLIHLKKTANTVQNDSEILGNIKHWIIQPFDHNKTDPDPSKMIYQAIKLFESVTGKLVDQIQYEFINNMMNDENISEYKVYELLMGRGKSYVIIPCILLIYYFNKKFQNVIQCVPSHLLTQSHRVMCKFLPFMTCGYIHNLNVSRNNSQLVSQVSRVLGQRISKIIITTDTMIKTNLLANAELQNNQNSDPGSDQDSESGSDMLNNMTGGSEAPWKFESRSDKGYVEMDGKQWKKIAQKIRQTWDSLDKKRKKGESIESASKSKRDVHRDYRDNTILVIDEFDMVIDPLKSDLNFPIGDYQNIDFQDILIKIILNITNELFTKYHTYMLRSDRTDQKLNKLIIRKIMLEMHDVKYQSVKDMMKKLYQGGVKKINKNKNIEQFNALTKDENMRIKQFHEPDLAKGHRGGNLPDQLLLYFIRETYRTYCNVLSLLLDKDYGWDKPDSANPWIAIPYSAQDTPVQNSQFSEIIINLILTSITYFQKGFREIDVKEMIKYIKFMTKKMGNYNVKQFLQIDEKLVDFALIDSANGFLKYIKALYENNYHQYVGVMCCYLEKIVLNQYVKIDPRIMNCSFIDIIDPNYIRAKFALSGTVNIKLPGFRSHGPKDTLTQILSDGLTRKNIEKAMRGDNLSTNQTHTITLSESQDTQDIINMMQRYEVLIDTGSFFRYMTNPMVGRQLSDRFKDHLVIYYDHNDIPRVLKNGLLIDYDFRALKHEKMYKVYFDQKHMIGTDLDLPSDTRGLVTVHRSNTRTQVAQGLFRMREINLYQTHDYLIKTDTQEDIENMMKSDPGIQSEINGLLHCLDQNEENRFKMAEYKYLQQTILCLYRTLLNRIPGSYQSDLFVPDLNDQRILDDYDFNYVKDHFITMMNNKLLPFNDLELNDSQKLVLREIQDLIEQFKNTDSTNSVHSVQRQSESVRSMNYNVNMEMNQRVQGTRNLEISKNNILYGEMFRKIDCVDIVNENYSKQCDDQQFEVSVTKYQYDHRSGTQIVDQIQIFEIVQKMNICISPKALMEICDLFGKQTNKRFYRATNTFIGSTILMTSGDLIVLRVSGNIDRYVKVEPMIRFTGDPVNDMLMLLCFNVPMEDQVSKVTKHMIPFKHAIKEYFDTYYKYKIESISPGFSQFLNHI
jgi:hypothetical protein